MKAELLLMSKTEQERFEIIKLYVEGYIMPSIATRSRRVRCLPLPAVPAVYPVSKSTWWAGVKSGRYPQPVKLGPKTTAWKVQDIVNLIDEMGGNDSMTQ